jgi:hypothetical protein
MPIRPEFRKFYGKKWREEIRPKIQARAGDRCEQCGAENGTFGKLRNGRFYRSLIQCGCAHLDHNVENNADSNLAWLCRFCHLTHDAGQHRETRSIRKDAARPLLQEATNESIRT